MGIMFIPAATAQKRTFATINPNEDRVNIHADFYFPQSGEFSPTVGNLGVPRENHVAISLDNGKVLIAGGHNNRYLRSAELFDPATGLFSQNLQTVLDEETGIYETSEGNMKIARSGAGAVRLLNGKVFIVGGYNGNYLSSAEIYDPSTGEFVLLTTFMNDSRHNPNVILLSDGRVLISGGYNGQFLSSVEVFDPITLRFYGSPDMNYAREGHSTTLLDDGTVLIVGGCANAESDRIICDNYIDVVEILDPEAGYSELEGLNSPRAGHTASLLPDGRVLIAGGVNGGGFLASAEIYDPEDNRFHPIANMGIPRYEHTATNLGDGKILMAGGKSVSASDSAEIFDSASNTFAAVSNLMSAPRFRHTANILKDGRILLVGGLNSELLVFDVNVRTPEDNISPNIVFSPDSQTGFVPYTGSGMVMAFSATTGEIREWVVTGGYPASITPLPDGNTMAVVSVFDNRIFLIKMDTLELQETFAFEGAQFGFGSVLALSPDGSRGYISSTGTGEVIQFDMATGNEVRRLADFYRPGRVTLTPDGSTLLVVEISSAQVYFVDTATMTTKFTMDARTVYSAAGFTIYNKPVLSQDGQYGVIGSQNIAGGDTDVIFYFETSSGNIRFILQTGANPAYTVLTPDNEYWLVLCANRLAKIPVANPTGIQNIKTTVGKPIGSANIVFSGDGRYAFHAASNTDRVLQQDLQSHGIVGSYLVGDVSDINADQPSSLAITPNGGTIAVLNFTSNELDLLTDASVLRVPEFFNNRDRFTGLTLINLSTNTVNLQLAPISNFGGRTFVLEDGKTSRVDPVALPPMAPNEQLSVELSQVFKFDNSADNQGHLYISSDLPGVVGFAVTGTIKASFLEAHLTAMNGMSLQSFPYQLHDWIMPDIPAKNIAPPTLSLINPNYNSTDYEIVHYGADGSILQAENESDLGPSYRRVQTTDDMFDNSQIGQVLIAGGRLPQASSATEIYRPDPPNFRANDYMSEPRYGHAAVLLGSGRVLVSGGKDGARVSKSAELYDPIDRIFIPIVGTMMQSRYRHTATLLHDGKVLVAGGQNSVSINSSAELYDPESETFAYTAGFMNSARDAHTATRLYDGSVLIAGGIDGISLSHTAEIYNPDTSEFNLTGAMHTGRAFHQAVLLKNGQVLITGGYNGNYLSSAEIYDPATGTFTEIPSMNVERSHHTATVLSDGNVLIAGGTNSSGALDSVEMYVPYANRFFRLDISLRKARSRHTATLLSSGDVLIISGIDGNEVVSSSELYFPDNQVFQALDIPQLYQWEHTATLLQDLIAGYLRGSSSIGLMFRGHYRIRGAETAINGIDVEKFEGITALYSPQFVSLLTERTVLNLINANDDSDATVRITLHDTEGTILAEETTILPVKHQINEDLMNIFGSDPAILGQEGWIEVSSDVDKIVGTVSFLDNENAILTTHELSGTPLAEFVIPLAAEDSVDYLTELSLLNPYSQSTNVEIEYRGPDGTVLQSTSFELGAETRRSDSLRDYFGTPMDRLYGYIYVRSDLGLHSISILRDRNNEFACAVPPIPVPGE